MIAEAINRVLQQSTSKPRESVLTLNDGSGRVFLYDDAKQRYEAIGRHVSQTGKVSNVESLAALVLEEARRRGPIFMNVTAAEEEGVANAEFTKREHEGDWMTVSFDANGATFSPDDQHRLDSFTYKRTLSQQWLQLQKFLSGEPLEHADFVRLLQTLRPSIVNYSDIIREFRKISFDSRISIASAPLLDSDGKGGNAFVLEYQARNTTQETKLPSEFEVEMAFARGSSKTYRFTVEVDIALVDRGEKKTIRFALVSPDLENVREQAIADEIAYFREQTASLPHLLTLLNF